MRVVVALGGNALLKRGEPMTAENQRANVRAAAPALAAVASGTSSSSRTATAPRSACWRCRRRRTTEVDPYPLDVLGAQTEGMIGYVIEQELGNVLPATSRSPRSSRWCEVDPADPAFENPTKFVGPVYTQAEADRLAADKGWAFKPDGDSWRRVVPSPAAEAHLRDPADPLAARARRGAHLRRRRWRPDDVPTGGGDARWSASRP